MEASGKERVRDEQIQEGYKVCSEGDGLGFGQLATASGVELGS